MSEIHIGISGINATDNPGPGVAVAKSLKEAQSHLSLIGLSYDVHDPGNYMVDLFSNSFLVPYPTRGWTGMKTTFETIQNKVGLDVLIPCLDAELPLMIKYQKQFSVMGIKTLLPTQDQFEYRNKSRLTELSKEIHCYHPHTEVVFSTEELVEVLKNKISLPAMVKGNYYKAYLVSNLESAVLKGIEIASEWGFPLLVQERISGQELNLVGLSDADGNLVGSVSIKKQLTTHIGKVWTAVTIRDERLDSLCERFCKFMKWRGPFELECIMNERGIYLIEINPRFPAWVYFATGVGINLPAMMLDLIEKGECTRQRDYPLGKYLVRFSGEFVADLENFQNLLSTGNRKGLK